MENKGKKEKIFLNNWANRIMSGIEFYDSC